MSTDQTKYASWIHECINLVRNRRSAFSDLDRICLIMKKCHGVSHEDTVSNLESMVNAAAVSRRAFKGVISYRSLGGRGNVNMPGRSSRVGRWIHEALKELDGGQGVTGTEIEKWVVTSHPYYHSLKGKIKGALKEDLGLGKIWQVEEGRYRLLESAESPERKIPDRSLVCDFCLQTASSNRKGEPEELLICRDCGNRAHPSCMDYSVELTARIRADGGSWQCIDCKACVLCQDSGDPSSLLFCDACDKGYHMQCHTPKLQSMPTGKWACSKCVSTLSPEEVRASIQAPSTYAPIPASVKSQPIIEEEVADVIPMIVEETPSSENEEPALDLPVAEEPKVEEVPPIVTEDITLPTNGVKSPIKSNVEQSNIVSSTDAEDVKGKVTEIVDTKPKNAFNWQKIDVVDYVKSLGFPKEALAFEEQEIDGPSLMVMSRTDLISTLKLKLGPALKIYAHVAKLQVQTLPSE